MVLSRASFPIASLLATAVLLQSCFQGGIYGENFKFVVEPITIQGTGPLGGILSALGVSLPFEQAIPNTSYSHEKVTAVYLSTIALRTTTSADYDSDGRVIKARITSDELIAAPCVSGQANVDFIRTIDIFIQKNQAGSPKVKVASFVNNQQGRCGFYIKIELDPATGRPYNLKNFLPHYSTSTSATGSSPSTSVKLGGYVGVDWEAPGISLPEDS